MFTSDCVQVFGYAHIQSHCRDWFLKENKNGLENVSRKQKLLQATKDIVTFLIQITRIYSSLA